MIYLTHHSSLEEKIVSHTAKSNEILPCEVVSKWLRCYTRSVFLDLNKISYKICNIATLRVSDTQWRKTVQPIKNA